MRRLALFVVLALVISSSAWANLLTNASFEVPATPAADFVDTGWTGINGGHQIWHPRVGLQHAYFESWTPFSSGYVQQDVSVSSTGTYTFSAWVRRELLTAQTNSVEMSIEWLDGSDGAVQAASVSAYTNLPSDDLWHQVFVSGTCDSSTLAKVRVKLSANWEENQGSSNTATFVDNADLYIGEYAPPIAIENPSMEIVYGDPDPNQEGNYWDWATDGHSWPRNWAWHSGSNGVALYGWDAGEHYVSLSQATYPGTGTYTFVTWMLVETNCWVTNAEMSIEWLDGKFEQIQPATSATLTVATNGLWTEYTITGTCTSNGLHEVRPHFFVEFAQNPDDVPERAAKIDDLYMVSGTYTGQALDRAWCYFSADGYDPFTEQVPGTNVGTFAQADYATTTTTFYVLGEDPSQADYYPDQDAAWEMYTSYERPDDPGNWITIYYPMTKQGTIELDSGSPFHGQPSVGTKTMSLWKADVKQPVNGSGEAYTNTPVTMYFAPFVKSTNGVIETDYMYMLTNGETTNDLEQVTGQTVSGNDYSYVNAQPVIMNSFTNGGFENPTNTINDFTDTGWQVTGDVGREWWAARSAYRGAYFPSWQSAGTIAGTFYQDIACTGGTYTLEAWFMREVGSNPADLKLRLQWYDSAYQLVQTDVTDMSGLPNDSMWHPAYVTGTCLSNDLQFVRVSVYGLFNPKIGDPATTAFDDVDFYQGAYQGQLDLLNGGFENLVDRDDWRGSDWAAVPDRNSESMGASRRDWAARSGNKGLALYCFTNDVQPSISNFTMDVVQNLTPGTGTYTFAIYALQEANAVVSNFTLSIGWYDSAYAELLDPATNMVATPLSDGWTRYEVTGTCEDPDLYEVRVQLSLAWSSVENSHLGQMAVKIDDARFVRGTYPTELVNRDWAYYNAGAYDPTTEQVPGTNVGAFMQVDYASTTTTFYALSDQMALETGETTVMFFRYYYYDPVEEVGVPVDGAMTYVGEVTLDNGTPFHGLPAVGQKTLDLWKYDMKQPVDTNDVPITNVIQVYYSPIVASAYETIITDSNYLVRIDGEYTNNYTSDPQLFSEGYIDMDWSYYNRYPAETNYHEGIPNSWWQQYFGVNWATNHSYADNDADTYDNLHEYIADTDPTNSASFYDSAVTNAAGAGATMNLMAGPPTSASRLYDVWWSTDITAEPPVWTPLSLDVPGVDATTPVTLTVTNTADMRYYRTGVKTP